MDHSHIRTDLALEASENLKGCKGEVSGISVTEDYDPQKDIKLTKITVETKNAARKIQKPMGNYITIEAPRMQEADEDYHREIAKCLAKQIRELIPMVEKEQSVLVVGLGNRAVTADSLGPCTVDNLFITRHMVKEYGNAAYEGKKMHMISSIEPGVMAKTGMETSEIIKGVIEQTKPDVLIIIDALAARSMKRLNRTIQITDTGICPGSGVGNHRNALSQESLGVFVIAIGVPTVIDAATIVTDTFHDMQTSKSLYELSNLYVTSKDVDAIVKRLSFLLSEGINVALEFA